MKKLAVFALALLSVFLMIPNRISAAPPDGMERASSAILVDADSGSVIFGKDEDKRVEAAGLKRLPSLLLICEAFDSGAITEDDPVTVSSAAAGIRGATAFLSPNEIIKAGYLLKAAIIINAGDANAALMDALYPGESAQKEAVSSRLSELGVVRDESLGEAEDCLYSASEIAKICLALSRSDSFLKYSSVYLDSIPHEKAGDTELANPNRLVRFYSGCYGLATGSVGSGEYSGAFIARRGSTAFIAVIAGMPDSASRFSLAEEMLNAGFASFRSSKVYDANEVVCEIAVSGGRTDSVEAVVLTDVCALLPVGETKVTTEFVKPEYVNAPVAKGDELGSLVIKSTEGKTLAEAPVYAKSAVSKARFSDTFMELIRIWLRAAGS